MAAKLFRIKLSGGQPGETVLIRIDDGDAYHLRNQIWTATRKSGCLKVQRTSPSGASIILGRYLLDCPTGKFVRHVNGDTHDFTRGNLAVRDDMCDDGISCRRSNPTFGRVAA